MKGAGKSAQLLVATLSLWILQTSMPVLEKYFPKLTVSRHSTEFSPPLSQLLNQFVGILDYLCAYCLLHACAKGRLGLRDNCLFLGVGFLIVSGHGMHSVCVSVERVKELSQAPEVLVLVDFLHEVVSHNMFVGGIYVLLALVMTTEMHYFRSKTHKKTDICEASSGHYENATMDFSRKCIRMESSRKQVNVIGQSKTFQSPVEDNLSGGGISDVQTTASSHVNHARNKLLLRMLFNWAFPLVMGLYFSIFATLTGTVPVTVLFYLGVYAYAVSVGLTRLWNEGIVVCSTVFKTACIGMPVLALRLAQVI